MPRKKLSDEELERVVKLRQMGNSWTGIQRATGIHRQRAQRAYGEWERNKTIEQLKEARKEVAAEEFRRHLNCLLKLAESLAHNLDIPSPSHHLIRSDEVLLTFWQRDIVGEYGVYGLPETAYRGIERYSSETCLRQNRILFTALKVHTREKVDWKILDQWQNLWDQCIRVQGELRKELEETLSNILKQKQDLKDRITKESGKEDVIQRMADGLLHGIWQGVLAGNAGQSPVVKTVSAGHQRVEVVFGGGHLSLQVFFSQNDLAKEVEGICHWAAKNLGIVRNEDIVGLVNDVREMRKAIGQLTEMLNPLVLRPLILGTWCDLCPV